MRVAILQLELSIPWAMSLKDKRRAVKGLKERLGRRFNISIAEVADNDVWRSAVLGVAAVGNDPRFLQSVCQNIVNYAEECTDTTLEDYQVEIL